MAKQLIIQLFILRSTFSSGLTTPNSELYFQQMQNLLKTKNHDQTVFKLHKLKYPTAPRCNDGSFSGYYLQKSNSKNWIIYLQGGLFCFDSVTCRMRLKNSPDLTSSKYWSDSKEFQGILSNYPKVSPFWNYNKVYIPYCSSDMWLGHGSSLSNFQFNGASILKAVFTELKLLHGMVSTHGITLSGTSAGAIGAVLNLNSLPSVPEKLILDSGWYLKNDEDRNSLDKMFDLLEVRENYRGCKNSQDCLYAPDLLLNQVKNGKNFRNKDLRVLVVQFQYDTIQYGLDERLRNTDFVNYIKQQPVKIKRSFFGVKNIPGLKISVFSPACEYHGLLESNSGIRKLMIGKNNLKKVIKSCFGKKECKVIDQCSFPNCNPTCPYWQDNGFIQNPETLKRLGINLRKMAKKNGFKNVKKMLYDIGGVGGKKKSD